MKITREELARMAIQTVPPIVNRTTTVANVSTTERFPVERADNARMPPQTRPAATPRPQAATASPPPATPRPLPSIAVQMRNRNPVTFVRPPVTVGRPDGPGGDPLDGVGPGRVPPGGVKMR